VGDAGSLENSWKSRNTKNLEKPRNSQQKFFMIFQIKNNEQKLDHYYLKSLFCRNYGGTCRWARAIFMARLRGFPVAYNSLTHKVFHVAYLVLAKYTKFSHTYRN
jgi:hypothetical protein